MADIKTNIDKIVDELNFYMRKYPNTYSEVKHLLFEIEEQEQEIRSKAIDEFVSRLEKHEQENWVDHQEYGITWSDIELIAEQIKEK